MSDRKDFYLWTVISVSLHYKKPTQECWFSTKQISSCSRQKKILFSTWYSWKTSHLALNNNHSQIYWNPVSKNQMV